MVPPEIMVAGGTLCQPVLGVLWWEDTPTAVRGRVLRLLSILFFHLFPSSPILLLFPPLGGISCGKVQVHGWACDSAAPRAGSEPISVELTVDARCAVARVPRNPEYVAREPRNPGDNKPF